MAIVGDKNYHSKGETFCQKMGFTSNNNKFKILQAIDTKEWALRYFKAGDKYSTNFEDTYRYVKEVKERDIIQNNNIQSVHIILINENNQILMILNKYTKKYQIPGGSKIYTV